MDLVKNPLIFNIDFPNLTLEEIHQLALDRLKSSTEVWEKHIWEFILQFSDPGISEIEISTSGSTGSPKKIKHSKPSMLNSAEATCRALGLKDSNNALLCLPANKIGGMMMIVRSIFCKMNLVCIRPSSGPLSDLSDNVSVDFVAFTPMQFQEIANSEVAFKKAQKIDKIILGGQDVQGGLLEQIRNLNNKVYLTFGMTETISHIALKKLSGTDASSLYTTLPGITVERNESGCLIIKAPKINQPHLVTNDVVNIISPRQFEWVGRIDNVINTGGIKIYPEAVEQRLRSNILRPFFIDGLPDEKYGTKLVLVIEADKLDKPEKDTIRQSLAVLEKFERPREILLVPKFEKTQTGKLKRKESLQKANSILL